MMMVGLLATAMGVGAAWLTAHYRFIGSDWLGVGLMLPLAAPGHVVGYVYADLLDVTGPLQSLLRDWAGWQAGDYFFPAVRSLPGASVVIALVLYPYIYLLAKPVLKINPAPYLKVLACWGRTPALVLARCVACSAASCCGRAGAGVDGDHS